jgi:hypothetical protein
MKLPRRHFLHLAAGAAALPAVSRVAASISLAVVSLKPPGGKPTIMRTGRDG